MHARAHKGSHALRGGVGDGCGGGSVEGVATGVEVAVAVMGTTGTRTRGGWGDSDGVPRIACSHKSRRPRGHRQGLVAAATAVAVMGVTCTCTRGGGGNGDVSSKLESKKNLSRNVCGGGYWAGSWRAPRGGVEAIVAATGLGRRGRCRGGSDEGWWHRRRDMTHGFKMKGKKKKKMAPGRMTARGWLACTCDAYEGDCNTRVDSATWSVGDERV
ncbi:hypothetical protein EDB89DRAFT_1903632 [Lactarius sanguifluus]|nr:hypothetical protein EDB89DRAFT_1903632 [Lactarius sanguifluus]